MSLAAVLDLAAREWLNKAGQASDDEEANAPSKAAAYNSSALSKAAILIAPKT
jgi:hypothetical protein